MRSGRIIPIVLAVFAIALVFLVSSPAADSQPSPGQTDTSAVPPTTTHQEKVRELSCRTGLPPEFCNAPEEDAPSGSSPSLWSVLLAVVVWMVIPLGLAASIADSRGESVVVAVVLTLVLGWIGLVVVYCFLGRNRRDEAALRVRA